MRWQACLLLVFFSTPLTAQTIAFISDLNGRYGSTSYHQRVSTAIGTIIDLEPELVVSTGDMVAGQRTRLDDHQLREMWQAFKLTVADPLGQAGIPFAVTAGNHDGSAYPQFAREREQFAVQWQNPPVPLDILPGSNWPRHYAVRLGPFLLIALDATQPGALPGGERRFLDQALQTYGTEADATVVFSHLPMWPLTRGREREVIADPELLTLLHRYGVDVFASGHHHAYYAGVDKAGMLHLGVGALGGNARAFSGQSRPQPHSFALLTLSGGSINVVARTAPGFMEDLPVSQLPASLPGPLGTLRRADGPVPLRP